MARSRKGRPSKPAEHVADHQIIISPPEVPVVDPAGTASVADELLAALALGNPSDRSEERDWWVWVESDFEGAPPPTTNSRLAMLAKRLIWHRSRSGADGPVAGNRFWFQGKCHDLPTISWRLLSAMWDRDSRDVAEVEDEVWDIPSGDARRAGIRAVNEFLSQIGYLRRLSKPRGCDALIWKSVSSE